MSTLDEIKEATKRFCRTDEAADNLAEYIQALITKARIDELQNTRDFDLSVATHNKIIDRIAVLKEDK